MLSDLEVVRNWQAAVNARDARALLEHSDPNVEIVGPRGSAFGHEVLSQWLERAGLSLMPQRYFRRHRTVVVAQHAVWQTADSSEAEVASEFGVLDGRVAYYARFDSLGEALAHAGLTELDEIEPKLTDSDPTASGPIE
jgi:hypothetical protein